MKFDHFISSLKKLITHIISWLLFGEVLVIIVQIISRDVTLEPLMWTEELARYIMIWMTFLGSALTVANKENVEIDFIIKKIPNAKRKWVMIFNDLLTCIFLFLVSFATIRMLYLPALKFQRSPNLQLPMKYIYISLPIGCMLMIFFILLNIVNKIIQGDNNVN